MSEPKYTPGPWTIWKRDPHQQPARDYGISSESIECDVADVVHLHDAPEESAANAKLIAAAPDLYEACKRLVRAQGEDVGAVIEAMDMARSAIAKAEGQ